MLGILRLVEDDVIYRRLIGRRIALHPPEVSAAVLAGAKLARVAGTFLAPPLVAVRSVAFKHWLDWRAAEGVGGMS